MSGGRPPAAREQARKAGQGPDAKFVSDMRVAALYDIHANFPALEAVLQDIRRAEVDRIVVGGDVLPGPMPRETIACLLDLDIPVQFIQGNGER